MARAEILFCQDKIHKLDDLSTKILVEMAKILKSERPVDRALWELQLLQLLP
jgi:hypothetical protein